MPVLESQLLLDENGWYGPYDYWFSLWGLYDLYNFAFSLLEDLDGKAVLDCGCGPGHTSVMLAKRGAQVTAFDTSQEDLAIATKFAQANGVSIQFVCHPFEELDFPDESFDYLFGTFVLHHVDVGQASHQIYRLLRPGGRAIFIENSGRNPILMTARSLICGRFGIPKFSDGHEYPLTQHDLRYLRQRFPNRCQVYFPNFLCFRLVDFYILQKRWPLFTTLLQWLDQSLGRLPVIRQYGYLQVIQLDKASAHGKH